MPDTSVCSLRTNNETNTKGNVRGEQPNVNNRYNQNFRNRFCGCECDYDPFEQKGTMFQCLGLGTAETGGCGEDWYHPGCLVGMGPRWFENMKPSANGTAKAHAAAGDALATITEGDEERGGDTSAMMDGEDEEPPMPPGFPDEDDFEGLICYKCVESNPWVKAYAGTSGFLNPVHVEQPAKSEEAQDSTVGTKRKADNSEDEAETKRVKSEDTTQIVEGEAVKLQPPEDSTDKGLGCKLPNMATPSKGCFSLFFKEGFRDAFCKCSSCYRLLNDHPQLLEEEEVYEPPLSEDGASQHGGSTNGSGSLLERGESALRNVDRVRAIEGVMAYNHLKERLKPFFQQFAESGQAIGAEDIKAYFAKLRGDEQDIKEAGEAAASSGGADDGNRNRREQGGY